jgi:hypothetical protein
MHACVGSARWRQQRCWRQHFIWTPPVTWSASAEGMVRIAAFDLGYSADYLQVGRGTHMVRGEVASLVLLSIQYGKGDGLSEDVGFL